MGLASNLDVSYDRGVRGFDKRRSLSVLGGEGPLSRTDLGEVLPFHPTLSLVRMTTSGPIPRHLPDAVIDPCKGPLGHDVLMKVGPSPDSRIQRFDQLLLACGFRFPENVPDFRQEGLDVLLRRRDQKFAVFVFSDLLSQENEPFRDVHDAGRSIGSFVINILPFAPLVKKVFLPVQGNLAVELEVMLCVRGVAKRNCVRVTERGEEAWSETASR